MRTEELAEIIDHAELIVLTEPDRYPDLRRRPREERRRLLAEELLADLRGERA